MEENLDPKISLQAKEEGTNVERVITEEVGFSSIDSFQKLMRESTRTLSASGPLGVHIQNFKLLM